MVPACHGTIHSSWADILNRRVRCTIMKLPENPMELATFILFVVFSIILVILLAIVIIMFYNGAQSAIH
jgi:hypothetical protein